MASLDLTRPQDLRLLKTLLSISSIAPRRSAQPAHLDSMATALSASAVKAATRARRHLATALTSAAASSEDSAVAATSGGAGFKEWYVGMLQNSPVVTRAATAFVMSGSANALGQVVAAKKPFDAKFTLSYAMKCAPPYSHFWYMWLDKMQLPVAAKVLLDQVFWRTLMTWWGFVSFGLFRGDPADKINADLRKNFLPTLKNGMLVWPVRAHA